MPLSKYTETYTTFSGADIVATFAGHTIATLSGITWNVTREKAPVYTLGSPNPRSFTRGKRGIAGTLIFTLFDRDVLLELIANEPDALYYTRTSNQLPTPDHRGVTPWEEQRLDVQAFKPYYADQIPPFDVTITFANEYGQMAVRELYGLEMLNEGSGVSLDDIVIEEAMTFVARELGPMRKETNRDFKPSET